MKFFIKTLGIILVLLSIGLYAYDKYLVFTKATFLLWLIGLFLFAMAQIITSFKRQHSPGNKNRELFYLGVLIFIASFLRFYKLSKIPILSGDESRDAGFLPEALLRGEIKDFFGYSVYGIPNLFFALSAIPHLFFGHSVLAIRFFAAFFGVISVLLVYFLAKRLFDSEIGLVSAFLMAFYHVHLHFSRSEFINNFDSFWAPLAVLLFFKTLENPHFSLLFGLTLGVATHFYQGIRAVLFLVAIVFLIFSLINFRQYFKRILTTGMLFLLGILLGLGPSIIVIFFRPSEFFKAGTAGEALVFSLSFWSVIKSLPSRFLNSFGSLVYSPIDFHYRYGGPFLKFPFNLFFLIGLLILLRKLFSLKYNILFLWILAVMFFNSVLLETPNFTHRLLSMVPAMMIVTGLGITSLARFFKRRSISKTLLILSILSFGYSNIKTYFYDSVWKQAISANGKVAAAAGDYSSKFPSGTRFYFLNSPRLDWRGVPSWEYLAPNALVEDVLPEKLSLVFSELSQDKKGFVFIVLPERFEDLKKIEMLWPGGFTEYRYFDNELLFATYQLF